MIGNGAMLTKEEEITCVFCGGRGRDPFQIMSHLSTCYVCGGEKKVKVATPNIRCSYCGGTGISPMGGRNHCLACDGRGLVHTKGKTQKCLACGGTGVDESTGLYCLECHGGGEVPKE